MVIKSPIYYRQQTYRNSDLSSLQTLSLKFYYKISCNSANIQIFNTDLQKSINLFRQGKVILLEGFLEQELVCYIFAYITKNNVKTLYIRDWGFKIDRIENFDIPIQPIFKVLPNIEIIAYICPLNFKFKDILLKYDFLEVNDLDFPEIYNPKKYQGYKYFKIFETLKK